MVSYAKATEYPINNPFRSPKGEGWELRRIAMVSYAKATEYPINNPFRSPKGEGWELRRIASEGSPFAKSPPMERRGIRRRRIKEKAKEKEKIFRESPFNPILKTHHLHGKYENYSAFSIDKSYQIMFQFLNDTRTKVVFINIGTHEIYR